MDVEAALIRRLHQYAERVGAQDSRTAAFLERAAAALADPRAVAAMRTRFEAARRDYTEKLRAHRTELRQLSDRVAALSEREQAQQGELDGNDAMLLQRWRAWRRFQERAAAARSQGEAVQRMLRALPNRPASAFAPELRPYVAVFRAALTHTARREQFRASQVLAAYRIRHSGLLAPAVPLAANADAVAYAGASDNAALRPLPDSVSLALLSSPSRGRAGAASGPARLQGSGAVADLVDSLRACHYRLCFAEALSLDVASSRRAPMRVRSRAQRVRKATRALRDRLHQGAICLLSVYSSRCADKDAAIVTLANRIDFARRNEREARQACRRLRCNRAATVGDLRDVCLLDDEAEAVARLAASMQMQRTAAKGEVREANTARSASSAGICTVPAAELSVVGRRHRDKKQRQADDSEAGAQGSGFMVMTSDGVRADDDDGVPAAGTATSDGPSPQERSLDREAEQEARREARRLARPGRGVLTEEDVTEDRAGFWRQWDDQALFLPSLLARDPLVFSDAEERRLAAQLESDARTARASAADAASAGADRAAEAAKEAASAAEVEENTSLALAERQLARMQVAASRLRERQRGMSRRERVATETRLWTMCDDVLQLLWSLLQEPVAVTGGADEEKAVQDENKGEDETAGDAGNASSPTPTGADSGGDQATAEPATARSVFAQWFAPLRVVLASPVPPASSDFEAFAAAARQWSQERLLVEAQAATGPARSRVRGDNVTAVLALTAVTAERSAALEEALDWVQGQREQAMRRCGTAVESYSEEWEKERHVPPVTSRSGRLACPVRILSRKERAAMAQEQARYLVQTQPQAWDQQQQQEEVVEQEEEQEEEEEEGEEQKGQSHDGGAAAGGVQAASVEPLLSGDEDDQPASATRDNVETKGRFSDGPSPRKAADGAGSDASQSAAVDKASPLARALQFDASRGGNMMPPPLSPRGGVGAAETAGESSNAISRQSAPAAAAAAPAQRRSQGLDRDKPAPSVHNVRVEPTPAPQTPSKARAVARRPTTLAVDDNATPAATAAANAHGAPATPHSTTRRGDAARPTRSAAQGPVGGGGSGGPSVTLSVPMLSPASVAVSRRTPRRVATRKETGSRRGNRQAPAERPPAPAGPPPSRGGDDSRDQAAALSEAEATAPSAAADAAAEAVAAEAVSTSGIARRGPQRLAPAQVTVAAQASPHPARARAARLRSGAGGEGAGGNATPAAPANTPAAALRTPRSVVGGPTSSDAAAAAAAAVAEAEAATAAAAEAAGVRGGEAAHAPAPAAAAAASTAVDPRQLVPVAAHGWLLKRSGPTRTWRRRYALLGRGGLLFYFKSRRACGLYLQFLELRARGTDADGGTEESSAEETLLQGVLRLADVTELRDTQESGAVPAGFEVVVGDRAWTLCPSPGEHAAWAEALSRAWAVARGEALRGDDSSSQSLGGIIQTLRSEAENDGEVSDEVGRSVEARRPQAGSAVRC